MTTKIFARNIKEIFFRKDAIFYDAAGSGNSYSATTGTAMLDAAIKASSNFTGVQEVIDAMKADQITAEKIAVEEILGSSYAGKLISQVSSSIRNSDATKYNDVYKKSNIYISDGYKYSGYGLTVEDVLNERKAEIFLKNYCGIQLNNKFWISDSGVTSWGGDNGLSDNEDTGAITGSDANITLSVGDVVNDLTLTAANLSTLKNIYGSAASLSSDGQSIVIGTGVEKTERSIVPEIGNKYTASTSDGQKIDTGSNDWIVQATDSADTIISGGADSIDAGKGNDSISVGADNATILTGAGNDSVSISAEVKEVTISDLNSSDVLTISGTFEIGSASVDNTTLIITDKTGTRKIRLGDLDNAKNAISITLPKLPTQKLQNISACRPKMPSRVADWMLNQIINQSPLKLPPPPSKVKLPTLCKDLPKRQKISA